MKVQTRAVNMFWKCCRLIVNSCFNRHSWWISTAAYLWCHYWEYIDFKARQHTFVDIQTFCYSLPKALCMSESFHQLLYFLHTNALCLHSDHSCCLLLHAQILELYFYFQSLHKVWSCSLVWLAGRLQQPRQEDSCKDNTCYIQSWILHDCVESLLNNHWSA